MGKGSLCKERQYVGEHDARPAANVGDRDSLSLRRLNVVIVDVIADSIITTLGELVHLIKDDRVNVWRGNLDGVSDALRTVFVGIA
jgi:hypothetical protein